MTTLHIWLDVPGVEAARSSLRPGDGILDLSFTASSAPLREALDAVKPQVQWHEHDMLAADTFSHARDALLQALGALSTQEVWEGRSLRDLFEVEQMSLWWHTALSEKRLRTDPLMHMLYRQWWMEHGRGAAHIARVVREHKKVMVWGEVASIAQSFGSQLRTRFQIDPGPSLVGVDGQPMREEDALGDARSFWSMSKKRVSGLRRHVALQRAWQETRAHQHDTPETDVLIATFSSGWQRDEQGKPHHTYFGDVAHALAARGVKVTWLPIGLLPDSARKLFAMMKEQPLPVCWDAFDVSTREVLALHQKMQRSRRRFVQIASALPGHEKLCLFGLDISPWVVAQLDHVVNEDALKFLLLRHVVERGVQLASPAVLLYRDEFYITGRAISAARIEGTSKWAMQHGLVSDDHWTYLNTSAEIKGKLGLPDPDRFLCYGDYTAELMTRWGYPESKIARMGSLRHDVMIARAAHRSAEPHWRAIVPEDRPVLTLCTQLIAQIPSWIERLVLGLRRARLHAHIAVKQHPFHRADALIARTFEALEWEDYSVHTQHLEQLLRQSEAALTENSTTGVEALIWGTPLICYREQGRYEPFPYVSGGGALDGVSVEAMAASLTRVLDPSQRAAILESGRAFLSAHFSNMQHSALDAFEEALDQIIRSVVDSS